jgi:hypothetical protein
MRSRAEDRATTLCCWATTLVTCGRFKQDDFAWSDIRRSHSLSSLLFSDLLFSSLLSFVWMATYAARNKPKTVGTLHKAFLSLKNINNEIRNGMIL